MELRIKFSVAIAFLAFVEWARAEECNQCIPLANCTSLRALWNNRNSIPGRNIRQVSQTLRNAHCGHRNRQPLVCCNDEEEEEEEDFIVGVARGVIGGLTGSHSCQGTVKLRHWNSINFGDVKTLRLRGTSFRNIRKLRNRQVFNAENHGNCCWKVYKQGDFSGESDNWEHGFAGYPNIQPKSVKRISCV